METSRNSLQRTYSVSPRASLRNTPSSVICSSSPRRRSCQVRNRGSSASSRNSAKAMPGIHQLMRLVQAGQAEMAAMASVTPIHTRRIDPYSRIRLLRPGERHAVLQLHFVTHPLGRFPVALAHGVTRDLRVPLTIRTNADGLEVSGET